MEKPKTVTSIFSLQLVRNFAIKFTFLLILSSLALSAGYAEEQDKNTYRLDTGDKIFIQVFDETDLTMEARVGSSGIINYSFLGQLQVAGRTSSELENEIISLLKNGYLVNPSVNVSILEYRPFFINGEVNRPGGYPYQPGLTLEKAIAIAGGLTDRASKRKMYLQNAQQDEQKKIKVSMDSNVSPGDIITIEEGFF
ncbi:MAG: polysaccharide export protein [Gammaproteobacteria bacterium]|nr:polysaccharide export protein [Gammaproteobacteria bacterium]